MLYMSCFPAFLLLSHLESSQCNLWSKTSNMSSRSRSRTGFSYGNVYSSGLSKSYGSGLSSGYGTGTGYSFSSGYTPSYSSGYSGYLARSNGNYYAGQSTTPSSYKKTYEPGSSSGKDYTTSVPRYSANVYSLQHVSKYKPVFRGLASQKKKWFIT